MPLSLLSLGTALEGRYEYEIVDGNFEANAVERLARVIRKKGIRYLGMTVMPGPQLVEAITVSRELKALGFRKLSARPRHYTQNEAAMQQSKNPPRHSGGDPGGSAGRNRHRTLVA